MNKMENQVDVLSMGRGIIPRMVMSDRNLTVEAKTIYCYIAACIGAGDTRLPSVPVICEDLNMGKDRFQKHKKKLIEQGYLTVQKDTDANGKYSTNVYVIQERIANG
ncbi:helix-turn-helix domain-containing protein [Trichococcus alkaliphilus]|uniref:helix-turn-helix domain-containing protein n=1 Tax=Trichococcus alkaliphilus TaxID=2052943 RepID=UPI000D0B0EE5|nr:helix-turn-helix domain-containing protein [Trichococcus alkaliphilus]